MNSWWRCRLMQRPITVPSRILSAAGRAVALVVMGHRPAFSGLERQARLRAVERLDLALLVDRDDVLDLLGELGIVGALEGANAVRLQSMRLPQALHGAQADADGFGHRAVRLT